MKEVKVIETEINHQVFLKFVCPSCKMETLRQYQQSMEQSVHRIECKKCGTKMEYEINRDSLKKAIGNQK